MIDIRPELARDNFRKLFVRGALFYCQNYDFTDNTTKDKFIFVLNGCNSSGDSHFFLPTSQVSKYRRNRLYKDSLYVFPEGSVDAFHVETAIIIANVHSKSYTYFEEKYWKTTGPGCLEFREMVNESIMDQIDKMVLASIHIPPSIKKEILPARYVAPED
jgi:hypothetical protein